MRRPRSRPSPGRPTLRATPSNWRRRWTSISARSSSSPDWEDGLWSAGSIAYDLDRYSRVRSGIRAIWPGSSPTAPRRGRWRACANTDCADTMTALESLSQAGASRIRRAGRAGARRAAALCAASDQGRQLREGHHGSHRADAKGPEVARDDRGRGNCRAAPTAGCPPRCPKPAATWCTSWATPCPRAWRWIIRRPTQVRSRGPAIRSEPNVHFRFGAFFNMQDSDRGIEEIKKDGGAGPEPCAGPGGPHRHLPQARGHRHGAHIRASGP